MSNFKHGDRVRLMVALKDIPKGTHGTVYQTARGELGVSFDHYGSVYVREEINGVRLMVIDLCEPLIEDTSDEDEPPPTVEQRLTQTESAMLQLSDGRFAPGVEIRYSSSSDGRPPITPP